MSDWWYDSTFTTMKDRADNMVVALNGVAATLRAVHFPMLPVPVVSCDWHSGKVYARVAHHDPDGSHGRVLFFVKKDDGSLWKAAGWKAPAKNFQRGTIATQEGLEALVERQMKGRLLQGF